MTTDEVTGRLDSESATQPPAHILEYLVETRIIDDESSVVASSLSGGVSNDVLAITAPGVDVVVKQALPKLRVEAEWFASPDRIITEAKALQTAGAILPDNVPPVLAFDEVRHLMVIGRAPRSSYEWKSDLMSGIVDDAIATKLGEVLARWHRVTAHDAALADSFGDTEAFVELRVDPFYRWVGTQHAGVRGTVDAVVDRMLDTKTCLVHGDFSPKNVLIGSANPWVIDWEVAHIGDPTFDLAFPITHLLCKALYRPESRPQYRRTGESFLGAYTRAVKNSIAVADEEYLTLQIACLLLARIDGKSPAPYLDDAARSRGRAIALDVLNSATPRFEKLWALG
ncbi:phosphotransferase family protein [Rhodococcus opacus]|jgi:aminoglycoside phosphotransferase (APT) family kinase protein|uniref:phosphotransferase family protein n=1 Tax=Rhodococcus opacus TaxID=37919 RepID=UPI00294A8445|nr:phosphotransferase [Rhodococcus opacus]MDV6247444.1 phosphotransferase [Rhodococcus opacus]